MAFLILILGVALWWAAHFFKRIAPTARVRLGNPGKGLVAAALAVSILLMILGYRGAQFVPVWQPPAGAIGGDVMLIVITLVTFAAISGIHSYFVWPFPG